MMSESTWERQVIERLEGVVGTWDVAGWQERVG